ncbi:hypothetical protein PHABIO_193 [Pseudomonas phage Phabio]|uniref:Uncharacterized protein n=1 Tax=Pseudomonas phage Phabio TaxID=2006668 RepID=A0A1Y0SW74_9CAUD|nr:head maturation protease [Pseudomonas phage Phabio]ARV76824.1 hypothetical protein PHABIO_193 [Pseudomonas phage Phabio]
MLIPVNKVTDNLYRFTIDLNLTPEGFENNLEHSNWRRLLLTGNSYAELGCPTVDDHIDPRIALMRLRQIYPERTCGHISVSGNDKDRMYCDLKPHGPHAHILKYLDSIRKLFVSPRLIFNEDSEIVNIITFDVVEVN